jgi:putative restriction endonuclease
MTWPERAMQIWQVLVAASDDRRTLTYQQVCQNIGINGAQVIAGPLRLIMQYCKQEKLPPLTCIVVQKSTGLPGVGLTTVKNLPKERESVYKFNWYSRYPVQIEDFE